MSPMKPLGQPGQRQGYLQGLAQELEAFLLKLEKSDKDLVSFVDDRVAFLNRKTVKLSDEAKAILLSSDYSVVQEVMSYRKSTAVRWVCVWVV